MGRVRPEKRRDRAKSTWRQGGREGAKESSGRPVGAEVGDIERENIAEWRRKRNWREEVRWIRPTPAMQRLQFSILSPAHMGSFTSLEADFGKQIQMPFRSKSIRNRTGQISRETNPGQQIPTTILTVPPHVSNSSKQHHFLEAAAPPVPTMLLLCSYNIELPPWNGAKRLPPRPFPTS